jgi:hypothetical protein
MGLGGNTGPILLYGSISVQNGNRDRPLNFAQQIFNSVLLHPQIGLKDQAMH